MSCNFVWIEELLCENGHNILPLSSIRSDYRGYPTKAVPLDVALDLQDKAFVCQKCIIDTIKYSIKLIDFRTICQCVESPCRDEQIVTVELVIYEIKH